MPNTRVLVPRKPTNSEAKMPGAQLGPQSGLSNLSCPLAPCGRRVYR